MFLRPGWSVELAHKLQKPHTEKVAQSPLPHPIPMLLMPCLVTNSFGITHILASAIVSQEVSNLGSFGYKMKWVLPFSLSVIYPDGSLVRRCLGAGSGWLAQG